MRCSGTFFCKGCTAVFQSDLSGGTSSIALDPNLPFLILSQAVSNTKRCRSSMQVAAEALFNIIHRLHCIHDACIFGRSLVDLLLFPTFFWAYIYREEAPLLEIFMTSTFTHGSPLLLRYSLYFGHGISREACSAPPSDCPD